MNEFLLLCWNGFSFFDNHLMSAMFSCFKQSAGEDEEEETGQGSVPRRSSGGTDTYIEIPKADGPLALSLLEKPGVDKKVKRHSIHGMMEEENVIRPHQEIAQLSLDEKKFLLAVERGDVASTRRMLQRAEETCYININCVDPLGRSALLMAIDNENLEMVELLIEHRVETKDALLHAISEEFVEAVEVLLDHEETIHKVGEPHSWEALPPDTATFTPDITPLILSAHRDNYEIIKILLDRGATLPMPHDVRCGCDECVTSRMEDSLRHSRSRINAYRALASPSLIALSSKDPILTAFELSWELRRLSFMEHEFKLEYQELRKQCQDFATALLDHTRSSYELEVLLNHDPTGPAFEHGERMHLNRLKLAIKLRQKKSQLRFTKMWLKFLFLALLCAGAQPQVYQSIIHEGIEGYLRNGAFSEDFQKYLGSLNMTHAYRTDAEKHVRSEVTCILCDLVLGELLEILHIGLLSPQALAAIVIELCIYLEIESPRVCYGAVSINVGTFLHIIESRPELSSHRACGILLQSYGCIGYVDDWSIDVPAGTTPAIPKGEISDSKPLNVLQISDIHYDPYYHIGSNANCGEPLCCQVDSPPSTNPDDAAGPWGDYRDCDMPFWVIEDALYHIAENHPEIDYLYYTGDIVSHMVWGTSETLNIRDNELIYRTLREAFPNVPIFPILGNHEPHPVNLFSPSDVTTSGVSTQWLFDQVAGIWGDWLGDETRETILRGGYYTVLVRPGFRIIALNSNVGYTGNFWLLYDDIDPFGQLQWLADTLADAERNFEFVHILSHVPSSSGSTYGIWSREYRRILDRFSSTITAAFNGHSHNDQLIVYHEANNPTEANGVAWNGGSLTTFSNKNPNYKIYQVDSENYEVLDFDSWIFNITDANLTPDQRPVWFKLYSFKEAYGLDRTAPEDLRNLAQRMVVDRSLIEQYARFYSREADTALAWGCDDNCLWNHICDLLRSEFDDNTQCNEILADW